jgi:hypothetical protein
MTGRRAAELRRPTLEAAAGVVIVSIANAWEGMEAAALALAVVGIYLVVTRSRGIIVAFYITGVVIAVLVVGVVSIASDPCLPFCAAAEARGRTLADIAMLGATAGWIAACLAHEPLGRRLPRSGAYAITTTAFVVLVTLASAGVASVDVISCDCG